MGLHQFSNSLHQIMTNPHVPIARGLAKHLGWQMRKVLDLFPFEQRISSSRIVATHRACSVSALIYSQGLYDYNNMQFVRWVLRTGGVFFDIGANIGSYTLVASEQKQAEVFAFEPHPQTFQRLCDNLSLNRRHNVHAVQAALGELDGTVALTDRPGSPLNHLVERTGTDSIPVASRRADSYCLEMGVQPRFVKLDVEGYEYEVLRGFGRYLEQVDALLIEMNGLAEQRGTNLEDVHAFLSTAGLIGPWRCNFDRRLFHRVIGSWREDNLYLSSAFGRQLLAEGWKLEGQK